MSTETLQILLLEDNQSHIELIRRALMPEGKKFNLTIAGTLTEARKTLKKASPGLMIANHHLPDGKGVELLPGDQAKLTFPIAILTGHGNEKVATAAMKAGAIDYIVKSAKTLADMPHIIERIMRVWQHITEHRQAEKELAKSEMKYRALINSVPALPWSYNIEKDIFTCVGEQITDMLGIRPDAMSDMEDWAGLIHPDDREYTINFCIEETKKGRSHEIEYRMKSADGGWIWIRDNISVMMRENEPAILSGFMLDITKRKQAEDALHKSEMRYHTLFRSTTDAIMLLDDKAFFDCNEATLRIFGCKSQDEFLNKHPSELSPPIQPCGADSMSLANERIAVAFKQGKNQFEWTHRRMDGTEFPADVLLTAMELDGKRVLQATVRDITRRREAQDALEKGRQQLRESLIGTVVAISKSVGARDPYTAGHQLRVARLARRIAQEMGLDRQRIDGLRMGASMHDIGKIYLPAEILAKPSQLSDLEFELVKTHAQVGYDILKDIPSPWPMADIAHQHHERMDGTGYPQGLKGNGICLEARIVAVADVVETMSAHRPYRPSLGINAGLEEIETHRGQWFEPAAVDACLKLFREREFSFE